MACWYGGRPDLRGAVDAWQRAEPVKSGFGPAPRGRRHQGDTPVRHPAGEQRGHRNEGPSHHEADRRAVPVRDERGHQPDGRSSPQSPGRSAPAGVQRRPVTTAGHAPRGPRRAREPRHRDGRAGAQGLADLRAARCASADIIIDLATISWTQPGICTRWHRAAYSAGRCATPSASVRTPSGAPPPRRCSASSTTASSGTC